MEHPLTQPARKLRLQGLSCSQIADALDLSVRVVERLVADLPVPEWTRRPRAKDELRARARELRAQGRTYDEIVAELGVSKSSCSLWLRDMPAPPRRRPEEESELRRQAAMRRWEPVLREREIERRNQKLTAAQQIGKINRRELLIAGAMLYWAEGCKSKPWRRAEIVIFINSDPDLIRLFLAWLRMLGVADERLALAVHVHESADVTAATEYWSQLSGIPASQFLKPTLKRHNPKTVRKNVGDMYRGCLVIRVRQSAELHRRIEGWVAGAVMGCPADTDSGDPMAHWRMSRYPAHRSRVVQGQDRTFWSYR